MEAEERRCDLRRRDVRRDKKDRNRRIARLDGDRKMSISDAVETAELVRRRRLKLGQWRDSYHHRERERCLKLFICYQRTMKEKGDEEKNKITLLLFIIENPKKRTFK